MVQFAKLGWWRVPCPLCKAEVDKPCIKVLGSNNSRLKPENVGKEAEYAHSARRDAVYRLMRAQNAAS